MWRDITKSDKDAFNALATHPLQSYEWGQFRSKTNVKVIRKGYKENGKLTAAFQLTLHPIPHTKWNIGYLPKGIMPTRELIEELRKIGKENNCIFIQLEPNVRKDEGSTINDQKNNLSLILNHLSLRPSVHPLFTKYTFQLDLTKSEEELLANMHPKTRYNIKIAKKHGVVAKEDNSDKAFERFWELTQATTKRQKFYAHTKKYHLLHWQTFPHTPKKGELSSHIMTGIYNGKTLTTFMLFVFGDSLYYPYGASSDEDRNVMHSTYTMWEAILWGKKIGLKTFDMWGAANTPTPDPSNPYYGFHRFKMGFGAKLIEFVGSYDLVINPLLYAGFTVADKLRWLLLRFGR